jgi:phosphomannomutase
MFAQAATAGLNSVGCDVIDVGLVATPTVQLAVEYHHAAGGIMLTASHNPIEWNALKFVGPDGIFLDGVAGTRVRELAAGDALPRANYNAIGGVEADSDSISRHLAAVLALRGVDVRAIRRRKFRVALDTVRGAGGAVMPELLERLGCRVTAINLETDGLFPRPPEPVPENLKALGALVRRSKADVGIAVDPDVDRLAIVDERGRPIGEDYTLAFAIRAVLGKRDGGRGKGSTVVCNLSTSLVVEDAAKDYGAKVVRAPVGEAHVARKILELKAAIGGEGNGGVMYPALHVGRDAPVAGALLLTLLARERVLRNSSRGAALCDRQGEGRTRSAARTGVRRAAATISGCGRGYAGWSAPGLAGPVAACAAVGDRADHSIDCGSADRRGRGNTD